MTDTYLGGLPPILTDDELHGCANEADKRFDSSMKSLEGGHWEVIREFGLIVARAGYEAGRASRAQSEWISVGDRLPNIGDDVWIAAWAWNDPTRGQRIYGRATFIEAGKSYGNWANPQDDDTEYGWWPPTHWMPLPSAPATLGETK